MTGEVTQAGVTMWVCAWTGAYVVTLLADSSSREHLISAPFRNKMVATQFDLESRGIEVHSSWKATGRVRRRVSVIMVVPAAGFILGLLALRLGAPAAAVAIGVGTLLATPGATDEVILRRRGYHTRSDMGRATKCLVFATRAIIVSAAVALVIEGWSQGWANWWIALAEHAAALVVASVAHRPATWAERQARRRVRAAFGLEATRGELLYLRAFGDDGVRLRTPFQSPGLMRSVLPFVSIRFEEALAAVLIDNGELVTVGRPGEELPELGATRTYLPDDDWQGAVRETAHRCQAIFLLAGLTRSLSWEVEQLRDWGLLGKTLILLPPDPDGRRSLQRLALVEELLKLEPIPNELRVHPGWVAVGCHRDGTPVHYLSLARDWAEYLGAITQFLASLSGRRQSEPVRAKLAFESDALRAPAGLDALTEANRRTLDAYAERQRAEGADGGR